MIPADQAPPHAHQLSPTLPQPPYAPNNNPEQQQQLPPGYSSPYRDLIHDAHHTAHVSNTPHGM